MSTWESGASTGFPRDVLLRDGSTVTIRQAERSDAHAVEWLLQELAPEVQRLRFGKRLSVDEIRSEAQEISNNRDRFTLLATSGEPPRALAEGGITDLGRGRGRITITVAQSERGRGLATHMLGALSHAAGAAGITELEAIADPENHEMINVIGESGFPVEVGIEPGRLVMRFPSQMTPNAVQQFEARERISAAQSVRRFLEPRRIALIGASRNRESISGALFHNLLNAGFRGPILPVNETAKVVQSVLSYPNVEDVPGDVDLAVIAVPASVIEGTIDACIRKGVTSLVIITAGFAEAGEDGRVRQREIIRRCRAEGIRIIGPNCMGILNTNPEIGLNATFSPKDPLPGNIAFASQSGALGLAIIEFADQLNLGVSSFVSLGNKADISSNDLLCYWSADEHTDVILLYLESFGNPRKFSQIAQQVGRHKPIVAVKSGRSSSGARAASSHTGALLAASDTTVDALFRQSGVIRTDTLAEMFDVAGLLAKQPLPQGNRIAVISNAGGPGILCADALEACGARVPELADETQKKLRSFLPPHAGLSNPVDLIASASADDYGNAVSAVLADQSVDALIVINIPIQDTVEDVLSKVTDAAKAGKSRKPVQFVAMTSETIRNTQSDSEFEIPVYTFPESAAHALAAVIDYTEWRACPVEQVPSFPDIRQAEAASIIATALEQGYEWLDPATCWQLLDCYGIPGVSQRVASSIDQIPNAARQLGSRLVLKAAGPDLLHKTELGAVAVDLNGADDAVAAARDMQRILEDTGHRVDEWIVQSMADDGVEMLVGAVHDPQFGPVIACGAGGVMVELMNDISFRLAPLTKNDATEMIDDLKGHPLLTGFRGHPQRDVHALIDTLLRLGQMANDLPQIAELDCNPVIVHNQGATVVDARIRVSSV
jgi:acetate---CoA ligase (ADP-forming)